MDIEYVTRGTDGLSVCVPNGGEMGNMLKSMYVYMCAKDREAPTQVARSAVSALVVILENEM